MPIPATFRLIRDEMGRRGQWATGDSGPPGTVGRIPPSPPARPRRPQLIGLLALTFANRRYEIQSTLDNKSIIGLYYIRP